MKGAMVTIKHDSWDILYSRFFKPYDNFVSVKDTKKHLSLLFLTTRDRIFNYLYKYFEHYVA